MKKILALLFCTLCVFTLFGCNEREALESSSVTAKASDFETHFYESDRYTLYLHEEGLTIYGTFIDDDRNSVIDEVVSSEGMNTPHFRKEYTNAKVKTKGDKYFITADGGLSLEFTKFMNHIIVDSEGMEYIRKAK